MVPHRPRRGELYAALVAVLVLLGGCGEDTEGDDLPNLLTGLSGVIIVAVVVWLIVRAMRRRRG